MARRPCGLAAHGGELGTRVAVGRRDKRGAVEVRGERHAARVDGEDSRACLPVRQRHVDERIEAAGPEEGSVDTVWPVGGSDHEDGLQRLDAIDFVQ